MTGSLLPYSTTPQSAADRLQLIGTLRWGAAERRPTERIVMSLSHGSKRNPISEFQGSIPRKPVGFERRFSCNRPIDCVCERIVGLIDQGWSYRSIAAEYELRVEALWGAVSWGVQKDRREIRQLRGRIRQLEFALARAGVATPEAA